MNISVSVLTNGADARIAALEKQLAGLQGALSRAGSVAGPGSGRQLSALAKYGNQLQWTGRQLQYNFTLPLAIAGAAAMKFAMDNEKAAKRIEKVYGDTTLAADVMKEEINALKGAFVALSNHYGVHQAEVLNIAADWAAAGASGVALAKGVEQTLRVMVLGEMQAAEATEALIAIQAQYNLSSEQLVETIAKLNVVENQTGISLQGLVQGFARAAGVAKSAGVDVEHLAAMMAALVPTAGSAAQAGNALKTIISRIQSVTPEARDLLERMGIAVDGVGWKSANASQKIELLAKKHHELDDAQRDVVAATIASRYQINKYNALMDSVYAHLIKNTKHTNYYGKALEATADRDKILAQAERELGVVLGSNPQKFKQIWVILENAMADIIQPLIPLILMAAASIKNLVTAFRGLPEELQKAIIMGLLFLALFGPLLRYIGSTMTLIGELGWFFRGLGKAMLFPITGIASLIGSLAGLVGFIFTGPAAAVTFLAANIGKLGPVALTTGGLLVKGFVGAFKGIVVVTRAFIVAEAALFTLMSQVLPGIVGRTMLLIRPIWIRGLGILAAASMAWTNLMRVIFVGFSSLAYSLVGLSFGAKMRAIWVASLNALTTFTIHWTALLAAIWTGGLNALTVFTRIWAATLLLPFKGLGRLMPGVAAAITSSAIWSRGLDGLAFLVGKWANLVVFLFVGAGRAIETAIAFTMTRALPAIWARGLMVLSFLTTGWGAKMRALWAAILAAFAFLTTGWAARMRAIWAAVLVAWTVMTTGWGARMRALWAAITAGWTAAMGAGMAAGRAVWAAGQVAIAALAVAFSRVMAVLGALAAINWAKGFAAVGTFLAKIGPKLLAMLRTLGMAMVAAFSSPWGWAIAAVIALLFIFRKQIAQLIQNIIDYFRDLPPGVARAFQPLVNLFWSGVRAIQRAFNALPQGVQNAMMAVVRTVAAAVRAVYRLFSYLNPFAHHSPSLVENVTNGMAEVKKQFASVTSISGPIKKAYADIKAFGKAIAGMIAAQDSAKQSDDRSNLAKFSPGAIDEYNRMIANIKVLTPLLGSLSVAIDKQQAAVDALKVSVDAANAALDKASSKLDELQAVADSAADSLAEAQQRLDDYANTPIKGMEAMSDKIFANEMAQKSLRLEMMKMEDAVGGIDNLKGSLDKLQGEIELLSGQQADLRAGGAGSEILGQYDDEIKALQDQQDSIKDTASEYDKMADSLDELQRQGEMLDLENSLAFDELTRQIEKAANTMDEMPFEDIMAGMQQAKNDVAKYTDEVNKANEAVKQQQAVVDAATAARDAIQAQYDAESAKLDVLKGQYNEVETAINDINTALQEMTSAAEESIRRQQEAMDKAKGGGGGGGGALKNFDGAEGGDFADVGGAGGLGREGGLDSQKDLIDQFTKDIAKETGDLFASFDIFGPIKTKWNQFTGWWKANVNPAFASAAGGIGEIWNNTAGNIDWGAPFSGIDWGGVFGNVKDTVKNVFETAREWGGAVWRLFSDDVKEIWDTIKEKFQKAIDEIGPELAGFKDDIKPISDAMKELWDKIKPVVAIIGGALLLVLKVLSSVLKNIVGPAADMLIGVVKSIIGIIRGWVDIITGIITGDFGKVWEGVKKVWSSTIDGIVAILKGAWGVIWGIVKGVVEGIIDFFVWLWDELVGHSIIPDMVNAIIDWFKKLWDKCVEFVKGLAEGVVNKWNELWTAVKDALRLAKDWISTKFEEFKLGLTIIWKALAKTVSDKWNELWTAVKDALRLGKDWIENKVEQLKATITSKWENLKSTIKAAWDWVWDQVKAKIEWAKGKIDSAVQGIKGVIDNVRTGWNIIVDAVKKKIDELVGKFNNLKDRFSFGGMFDGIKSAFKSAINWLIEKWNNLSFPAVSVGGVQLTPSVGTPNIGYLAKGGLIARHATAVVGEGRAGYPEYVIPTDPTHRRRAMALFSQLGSELGSGPQNPLKGLRTGYTSGGIGHAEARVNGAAGRMEPVTYGGDTRVVNIHIHGNLEFPNIKSGDDADRFISNLESLAGGGN